MTTRAIAVALAIALTLQLPLAAGQQPYETDCTALLAGLEKTLALASSMDPAAILLAMEALDASLPPDLAPYHEEAYRAILELSNLSQGLLEGSVDPPSALAMLDRLQESFPQAVNSYSNQLLGCSQNPALARTIKVRVDRLVDSIVLSLIPFLVQQAYQAGSPPGFEVEVPARVVAGQAVEVVVRAEGLEEATAYLRPVARPEPLAVGSGRAVNGTARIMLSTPTAEEAMRAGYSFSSSILRFYVVVKAEGPWGESATVRLLEVEYKRPRASIVTEQLVWRGENMTVNIILQDGPEPARATITLDGAPLTNTSLRHGDNIIVVPTWNLTAGNHRVGVRLDPQGYYSGLDKDTVFAVVEKSPRVNVTVSNPSFDLLGRIRVVVASRDNSPVIIDVYVDGEHVASKTVNSTLSSQAFLVPGTLLPVWEKHVEVVARYPGGEGVRTASSSVYVVNPISTILFITIAVPAILVLQQREKTIIAGLASRPQARRQPARMGPVSRVYYRLLATLGLEPPLAWETLREHWARVSRGLEDRVSRALWRILVLVEEELYSPRRPDPEEAEEIAEEAIE